MKLLRHYLLIGILMVLSLLIGGLLILVHRAIAVSPWWQLAEIGVIFIIYGVIELSTRVNILSFLRNIRSRAKAEAGSPSCSVYEPARVIYVSTFSPLEEISVAAPPAPALGLMTPRQVDGAAEPHIYLHQDYLYSQN